MTEVNTICTHCADGCTTTLGIPLSGEVAGAGRARPGVNGEFLCINGRHAGDLNQHPARLRKPLIRMRDRLVPVSWPEAIQEVTRRFQQGLTHHERFGVIGSTRTTNEENYYLRRLAREGLKTESVDHHRTGDVPGMARALHGRLRALAVTSDLYTASAIVMLGCDLSQAHPLLAYQIRANVNHHGGRVYAATAGPVQEDDIATVALRAMPGCEVEAIRTLEAQLRDERDIVVLLGGSVRCDSISQLVEFVDSLNVPAKFVCLLDFANARGAVDMGLFPGPGGLTIPQMLEKGATDILWVVGANPFKSRTLPAMRPYLVVQELFLTETAQAADVVLPAASAYEKNGTYTNTCGEVQWLRKADASQGTKEDLEIFGLVALGLGVPLPVPHPETVFEELRGVVPGYDLPLERLMLGEAIQTRLVGMWPDQIWDAGLVEPAQFTQFRLGTPGRYSQVTGNVIESEVPLYSWPQIGGLGSSI